MPVRCGAVYDRAEHVALHREIESFECELCGTKAMLVEFDQDMMANMTAALAYVCKRIPADKDSYDTRIRPLRMAASKSK